jgi:hypothetical protein
MFRRFLFVGAVLSALLIVSVGQSQSAQAQAQERAFGQTWGSNKGAENFDRFYHYPYVTYPQNYWGNAAYRSADSLYYRYKPEYRIPVYNKQWHNYYPSSRRYHWGHQFITDIF